MMRNPTRKWRLDVYSFLQIGTNERFLLRKTKGKVHPETLLSCYYVKFKNKAIGKNIVAFGSADIKKQFAGQIMVEGIQQSICRIKDVDINLTELNFNEVIHPVRGTLRSR